MFNEMKEKFGAVVVDGKEYALTQQAYADNYGESVRYYANGIDAEEKQYDIAWDITEVWKEATKEWSEFCGKYSEENQGAIAPDYEVPSILEDESNACDWDSPVEVVGL